MQAWVPSLALLAKCIAVEPPVAGPDETPTSQVAAAPAPDSYARLQDVAGPVAGLTGYSTKLTPDATFCGGFRIDTRIGSPPHGDDESLATDMFALQFPRDLDWSAGHEKASKAFDALLRRAEAIGERAHTRYDELAAHGTDRERLEALARYAQLIRRFASVLVRAPIPAKVRKFDRATDGSEAYDHATERIGAYCGALRSAAEPLVDKAEELTRTCAEQVTQLDQHGWWDDVCLQR
jgi:hypothetical protein